MPVGYDYGVRHPIGRGADGWKELRPNYERYLIVCNTAPKSPLEISGSSPECPKTSSSRPSAGSSPQYLIERDELSALSLIFIASVFNLITSGSMAFPDTAFTLRGRLFEFPADEGGFSVFGKYFC
jgi:hypothetical protein